MSVPGATDVAVAKGLGQDSYPSLGIGYIGTIISMCNLQDLSKFFNEHITFDLEIPLPRICLCMSCNCIKSIYYSIVRAKEILQVFT